MNKTVKTNNAPQAIGPYSQGIDTGEFIFFSGQIGLDPSTGTMTEGIEAQTHQVLRNIKGLLGFILCRTISCKKCSWRC